MTVNNPIVKTQAAAKHKTMADLFCGAGGSSTGALQALKKKGYTTDLFAANHWDVAIATHQKNHPTSRHRCKDIDLIRPRDVVPSGHLDLFWASPTCTHHSNAAGGRPTEDQKRADGWDVLRWVEQLDIDNIGLENVPEWQNWGPCTPIEYDENDKPIKGTGQPIKAKKGLYFRKFIETLQITHNVEYRVLNCADYGSPTTRRRLFVLARKGDTPIVWPKQTHYNPKKKKPVGRGLKPWMSARDHVIDWSIKGTSIFNRKADGKKALSKNTIRRIYAGLWEYGLKDWILNNQGESRRAQSPDDPLGAVLGSNHKYLIEPIEVNTTEELATFLTGFTMSAGGPELKALPTDSPLRAVLGRDHQALVEPYLVRLSNNEDADDLDIPAKTLTTRNKNGLAEGKIEAFTFKMAHSGNPDHLYIDAIDDPISCITNKNSHGLIQGESFIIPQCSGTEHLSIDKPMSTVLGNGRGNGLATPVITPFLVQFNTTDRTLQPVDKPIGALGTKERYALCIPQFGIVVDILFRMLQPHELAAAQGFPKGYIFTGNKSEIVKQIGNAVPPPMAKALVGCLI